MASVGKLSYQRLGNEQEWEEGTLERAIKKTRAWLKIRALAGRRSPKLGVPRLRRFLRKRRSRSFLSSFRVPWRKALKKLKNGQSHMNDLFGGNYLFMHYNPTPFRCGEKPYMARGLHGLPSTYY